MEKRKAGLHKKVSSIFDGVAVPKPDKSGLQPIPSLEQKSQQDLPESPVPEKIKKQPKSKPVPKAKSKRSKRKRYKFSASIQGAREQSEKKKIMIMVTLVVLLAFILIKTFLPMLRKKGEARSRVEDIMAQTLKKKIDTTIVWKIPELYPATVHDPMRAGQFRGSATNEWGEEIVAPENDDKTAKQEAEVYGSIVIKSILHSSQGRSVVIGNKILYEGNIVKGATIIKINRNNVIFSIEGHQFTVPLQY